MAGIIVGLTLEHLPARNHLVLSVAVVLAEAADQDGANVYPAVARVARLARCSERAVQRVLQELLQLGFLRLVARGGGRGRPSRYLIDRGWLETQPNVLDDKGAPSAPFPERVNGEEETPQKRCKKCVPSEPKECTNPVQARAPHPKPLIPIPPTLEGAAYDGGKRGEDIDELVAAAAWAAAVAGMPPRSPAAFAGAVRRRMQAGGPTESDLDALRRFRAAREADARHKERLAASAQNVQAEANRVVR